ncbi:MAG TPA: UbiA family prenyltransferase [Clostridia bacterium]|nr:UbiA family prenyltransferase [Clostridia bacterium]
MSFLRTILALSRPSRLPTIWSNCLAGWWLGGGGNAKALPFLLGGATCLFVGGAFLNDAFDADFDREHRRFRPIPSGAIGQKTVWRWGLSLLAAGALLLLWLNRTTGGLALALVFCLVVYNALHRYVTFSPILKGVCRFFLYVIGASVATYGITGWSIWCGIALAIYMTGVGYFARWERLPHQTPYWPAALLGAPIVLALLMNTGRYREPALLLSVALVLWLIRCLRPVFWSTERRLDQAIPGLIAGVVFVDWLATCPVVSIISQSHYAPRPLNFAFLALLFLTLLLQRLVPER